MTLLATTCINDAELQFWCPNVCHVVLQRLLQQVSTLLCLWIDNVWRRLWCPRVCVDLQCMVQCMVQNLAIRVYVNVHCMVQKLAKHAEPAAQELSDKMEGGAEKFAKHAGPATKEFSERAVDAAKDVEKHAAVKAHKVWTLPRISHPATSSGACNLC